MAAAHRSWTDIAAAMAQTGHLHSLPKRSRSAIRMVEIAGYAFVVAEAAPDRAPVSRQEWPGGRSLASPYQGQFSRDRVHHRHPEPVLETRPWRRERPWSGTQDEAVTSALPDQLLAHLGHPAPCSSVVAG